jgi:hypothetical protein
MVFAKMSKQRLILDIRYYQSDVESGFGQSLPGGFTKFFSFPRSIHDWGPRIARKLREYGFITGSFDHLYVNFTTARLDGELCPTIHLDDRIFYFDFGLDPSEIDRITDDEKEEVVVSSTFRILDFIAGENAAQRAIVNRVRDEIRRYGSELEIAHKTKETKSYSITVTYQIRPSRQPSVGLLKYVDKHTGECRNGVFVQLDQYEDIYALVASTSVKNGVITIKPRSSFKASLYTERYDVPIVIPISQLALLPEASR